MGMKPRAEPIKMWVSRDSQTGMYNLTHGAPLLMTVPGVFTADSDDSMRSFSARYWPGPVLEPGESVEVTIDVHRHNPAHQPRRR